MISKAGKKAFRSVRHISLSLFLMLLALSVAVGAAAQDILPEAEIPAVDSVVAGEMPVEAVPAEGNPEPADPTVSDVQPAGEAPADPAPAEAELPSGEQAVADLAAEQVSEPAAAEQADATEQAPADVPGEAAAPAAEQADVNEPAPADVPGEAAAPAAEQADANAQAPADVPAETADPAADAAADLNNAAGDGTATPAVSYDYNAELYQPETGKFAGVYETAIDPNTATAENAPTIGMPSIADGNLSAPTTESPAIIQGAAVGYEEKIGPTEYRIISERPEPYTDFRYNITEQQAEDGSMIKKLTGFDGTYVITRLDVSSFFNADGSTSGKYLHMKQEKNMALIPGMGMTENNHGFADQTGNKTGSYLLSDLLDQGSTIPYINVILFSTGKAAAGADKGKTDVPNGDVPLQLYLDDTFDYNPDLTYDPLSTDPNHQAQVLAKFFDASKVAADAISRFNIKGSDLALEIAVENSAGSGKDTGTTYWSLEKGFEDPYYDLPEDSDPSDPNCGRTMKLVTEVPVTSEITFQGTDENNVRKRTLDVNSFDIQVANNTAPDTQTYTSGLTLQNSWLTIADKSNTTGAEMAIGNNSRFVIDQGGRLIIDETCQLEIEWDGATTTPAADGTVPAPDTLNNGMLDLRPGGTIVNNGIISIEGTEGKPVQPDASGQTPTDTSKGYGEMTIEKGATLINNGCIVVNGRLYNLGTLVNNGRYNQLIVSNDPDKGLISYHKGIQVSWKDDVTQPNVTPGALYNGKDKNGTAQKGARLYNNGDIVLVPGSAENLDFWINQTGSRVFLAAATEAIIPITPTAEAPNVHYKRITLSAPVPSSFTNSGSLLNYGRMDPATVGLNDNQSLGALTSPGNHPELFTLTDTGVVANHNHIYGWPDPEPVPDPVPDPEIDIDVRPGGETGDTWLYLYEGASFVLRCPDGTKLNGTLRMENGVLVFTPEGGEDILPETDASGRSVYTFPVGNSSVAIALTPEFLAEIQEDATASWICVFHRDGTWNYQALAK